MTAQEDKELFNWLLNASRFGGQFIASLAQCALHADGHNYPILRGVLLLMKAKYPYYDKEDDGRPPAGKEFLR